MIKMLQGKMRLDLFWIQRKAIFCQIVPPIVAYSLESMHLARYFQMKTYLITTYDRDKFTDIVLKTKANHYNIVPSFAKVLINNHKLKGRNLSFIKSCQYGGEGISPKEDEAINKVLAGKGRHGFGQNEEFGGFAVNYDVPGVTKSYGCCGFPLYGNSYIIVERETGKELPYGKNENGSYYIGDLYVCGPTVMKGYLGDSARENENTIIYRDGEKYIRTGDEAYIDEEGRLWYWTREQRIIRTQEGKVFTNIIEDILHKIPEIKDCCVVKSPHPRNVAEVSCHIVLKQECWEGDVNSIIEKIIKIVEIETQSMYSYYVPGTYEFRRESLPMTPFGKIDFMLLEKENIRQYEENNHLALKKIRIAL